MASLNPLTVIASIPRRRLFFVAVLSSLALFVLLLLHEDINPRTNTLTPHEPYSQHPQGQNATTHPRILLVSALFPLSKSKHSLGEYSKWLNNFLGSVTTDVYFFTPPELEPLVRKARGNLPITIDTTFSSPFDIPPLANHRERYREMHAQDRERRIHSPELYAVWNGKPFYLDEAVKRSVAGGKTYDYAFWNDAGSFRVGHAYRNWPDPRRIEELWEEGSKLIGVKKEEVLFFPICGVPNPSMRFWQEGMGPVDNEVSEGAFHRFIVFIDPNRSP